MSSFASKTKCLSRSFGDFTTTLINFGETTAFALIGTLATANKLNVHNIQSECSLDGSAWINSSYNEENRKQVENDSDTFGNYFIFLRNGFICIVSRAPAGFMNGYVFVGKDHPMYAVDYTDVSKFFPFLKLPVELTANHGFDCNYSDAVMPFVSIQSALVLTELLADALDFKELFLNKSEGNLVGSTTGQLILDEELKIADEVVKELNLNESGGGHLVISSTGQLVEASPLEPLVEELHFNESGHLVVSATGQLVDEVVEESNFSVELIDEAEEVEELNFNEAGHLVVSATGQLINEELNLVEEAIKVLDLIESSADQLVSVK